jgi:hypothetical protein
MPGPYNTIEQFKTAFVFTGYSDALKATALSQLYSTYLQSETVRNQIDQSAAPIPVEYEKGAYSSVPAEFFSGAYLEIDPDYLNGLRQIKADGSIVQLTPERSLAHELQHYFLDIRDGDAVVYAEKNSEQAAIDTILSNPSSDWRGPTVAIENTIALNELLGENAWTRISYFNGLTSTLAPAVGERLIDSDSVERIFSKGWLTDGGHMDLSKHSGSSLVIFTGTGDHEIIGSQGDDFLYGGVGNDTLFGNSGSDYLHGGFLTINRSSDGQDTVDYSKWDSFTEANGESIIITIGEAEATSLGVAGNDLEIKVLDGHGGEDRLVSIETIIGTNQDDTITLNDFVAGQTSQLEIDLGDNTGPGTTPPAHIQGHNTYLPTDDQARLARCFASEASLALRWRGTRQTTRFPSASEHDPDRVRPLVDC